MLSRLKLKPVEAFVIGSVFILLYVINSIAPFLPGDDFLYQLKFPSEGYFGTEKIKTITELFESTYNHYINYNYRIAPHFILQLIFLTTPICFDFINSVVLLALPLILLRVSQLDRSTYIRSYFVLFLFIWCFHPDIYWSYLWTTGSITYSWFLLLQLFFLSSLMLKARGAYCFGTKEVFVSLLIASSSENALLSIIVCAIFVTVFTARAHEQNLDVKLLLSLVILIVGASLMLFSPSLKIRAMAELNSMDMGDRLLEYLCRLGFSLLKMSPILGLAYFFKKNWSWKHSSKLYLLTILLSLIVMLFAPLLEMRSTVFAFMVLIMMCIDGSKGVHSGKAILPILLVLSGIQYSCTFIGMSELNERVLKNTATLMKEKGMKDSIYLDSYCWELHYGYKMCDDVFSDTQHFHNKSLSAFYGYSTLKLSDEYTISNHRDHVKELLELNAWPGPYQRLAQASGGECNVYYMEETGKDRVVYVFEVDESEGDEQMIALRATHSKIFSVLLRTLPLKYRIYFLRILEMDNEGLHYGGKRYYVNKVFNNSDYESFYFAKYSRTKHRITTAPKCFENPVEAIPQ